MLCGYGQSAQSGVDMARMHNAAWRITVEAVEKQMPQYPLSRLHTQVSSTVKKVSYFPIPSRDVTNQTLPPAGSALFRVWLASSRLGTGASLTLFYSVG
jgi:hypothetical protein